MKNKINGLIMNILTACLAVYAAYSESEFAVNIFTGLTLFALSMVTITIFAITLLPNEPNIKTMLRRISEVRPLWFNLLDRISDIAMIVALIGFGHWWKGVAWFIIHFVATSYIRGVAKISNNVLQPTQGGAEQNCAE